MPVKLDFASAALRSLHSSIHAYEMDTADIGRAIRALRLERGHNNQAEFAILAGMDAGNLSRIETGQQEPTLRRCNQIAKALGIQVSEIYARAERIEEDPRKTAWMRLYESASPEDIDAIFRLTKHTDDQPENNAKKSA